MACATVALPPEAGAVAVVVAARVVLASIAAGAPVAVARHGAGGGGPGLPAGPRVRHWARDWTTKLALVGVGAGLTTIPADLMPELPPGVQVSRIRGVPKEVRLLSLVHRPDEDSRTVSAVLGAFGAAARELSTASSYRPQT